MNDENENKTIETNSSYDVDQINNQVLGGSDSYNSIKSSSKSSFFSILMVCYATYVFSSLPAFLFFYYSFVSYIFLLLSLSMLLGLPLILQVSIFGNNKKRTFPRVFIEVLFSLLLLYLAGNIAVLVVGLLSEGRNSTPSDVLIFYLFIIFALFISSVVNAVLQYRVLLNTNNRSPGKLVLLISAFLTLLSIILIGGAVYQYGYIETKNRLKTEQEGISYNNSIQDAKNKLMEGFMSADKYWYVYASNSETKYTTLSHEFKPATPANQNYRSPQPERLSSTYQSPYLDTKIRFLQWEYREGAGYQWPTCTGQGVSCDVVPTDKGDAACRYMYGRLDCQLKTKENQILWLQFNSLSEKVNPAQLFNDLVLIKSSDITLTGIEGL